MWSLFFAACPFLAFVLIFRREYIVLEAAFVQVPADGGIESDSGATPDIIVNKL